MLFKTAVSAGRALSSSLLVEINTTSKKFFVKFSKNKSTTTTNTHTCDPHGFGIELPPNMANKISQRRHQHQQQKWLHEVTQKVSWAICSFTHPPTASSLNSQIQKQEKPTNPWKMSNSSFNSPPKDINNHQYCAYHLKSPTSVACTLHPAPNQFPPQFSKRPNHTNTTNKNWLTGNVLLHKQPSCGASTQHQLAH